MTTHSPDVPRPTTDVRYIAFPAGSGGAALIAVHPDGRLAFATTLTVNYTPVDDAEGGLIKAIVPNWCAMRAPDWASLWPADPEPVVADAPEVVAVGTLLPISFGAGRWRCRCSAAFYMSHLEAHCAACGTVNPAFSAAADAAAR